MPAFTDFQVSAALWVARAVSVNGVARAALEAAFQNAVTQGRFPRPDLESGLRILIERELLLNDGHLVRPHESVSTLVQLADDAALPLLATLLGPSGVELDVDSDTRGLLGQVGELAVLEWCASELVALGRIDLSSEVRQVSLVSDWFGYDVSAPCTSGPSRQLEVKTTGAVATKTFRFFLTRNEYEVGRRNPGTWALVACHSDGGVVAILGWCRASELERYLPDDASGRWTEALVYLPIRALLPGVPSAVY